MPPRVHGNQFTRELEMFQRAGINMGAIMQDERIAGAIGVRPQQPPIYLAPQQPPQDVYRTSNPATHVFNGIRDGAAEYNTAPPANNRTLAGSAMPKTITVADWKKDPKMGSLSGIAQHLKETYNLPQSVDEIIKILAKTNGIEDINKIDKGQELKLDGLFANNNNPEVNNNDNEGIETDNDGNITGYTANQDESNGDTLISKLLKLLGLSDTEEHRKLALSSIQDENQDQQLNLQQGIKKGTKIKLKNTAQTLKAHKAQDNK